MVVRGHGFEARPDAGLHVQVELDLRSGLPSFAVLGLTPTPARDLRERVQAAMHNSGFAFPRQRVTANLAPVPSRRCGGQLDLALACCVLAGAGQLDPRRVERVGLYAELGLSGALRPCADAPLVAEVAAEAGLAALIVAYEDRLAAAQDAAIRVVGARNLTAVMSLLTEGVLSSERRPVASSRPLRASREARRPAGVRRRGGSERER